MKYIVILFLFLSSFTASAQNCTDCQVANITTVSRTFVQKKAWTGSDKVAIQKYYQIQVFVLTNEPTTLWKFGHMHTYAIPFVQNNSIVWKVFINAKYSTKREAKLIGDALVRETDVCEYSIVPFYSTY